MSAKLFLIDGKIKRIKIKCIEDILRYVPLPCMEVNPLAKTNRSKVRFLIINEELPPGNIIKLNKGLYQHGRWVAGDVISTNDIAVFDLVIKFRNPEK
jgi:hypothetical protein